MDSHEMKVFEYKHLPADLQDISKPFHDLAWGLFHNRRHYDAYEPELDVALRKLLEAKDAAVRACGVLSKGHMG